MLLLAGSLVLSSCGLVVGVFVVRFVSPNSVFILAIVIVICVGESCGSGFRWMIIAGVFGYGFGFFVIMLPYAGCLFGSVRGLVVCTVGWFGFVLAGALAASAITVNSLVIVCFVMSFSCSRTKT